MSLRAVKVLGRTLLHRFGVLGLVRITNRSKLRILMHHHFPEGEEGALAAQCAHIQRYYHAVSMTEAGQMLRAGKRLPPNALAITIDDGYRDFIDRGYLIFKKYSIPVTVFLVSDFLDRKDWLWMDRVKYAVANSQKEAIEVTLRGESLLFMLATPGEKDRSSYQLRERLKRVPDGVRRQFVDSLTRLTGVQFPEQPPPDMAPLTWQEVRRMDGNGVDFGPHTMSHPILSNLPNEQQARNEILGSKRRVEEELGRRVEHFCYPSGQAADVSEGAIEAVREGGFATAVTSEIGLAQAGDDPLLLRRIGISPGVPTPYFRELISGFTPTLRPESRDVSFRAKVRAAAAVNGTI